MSDTPLPSAYGDTFADVYDAWYSGLADDDFVAALVRRLPDRPVRILELGVGTGRLLRKLVELRHPHRDTLVGIDASLKMLDIARESGIAEYAELECKDFSTEFPSGHFDAIFVGYNTLFNLPHSQAIADCLSLVATALTPGGFFMCDLVIPRGDEYEEFSEERTTLNGERVVSNSRHDPQARTISGEFVQTITDGHTTTRSWNVHYVLPDELDDLASRAMMRLLERTEDGHGTPFTSDSSRHISTYILR